AAPGSPPAQVRETTPSPFVARDRAYAYSPSYQRATSRHGLPDFTDGEVVAIACRRRIADRHARAAQRDCAGGSLHPVGVADRRQILMNERLPRSHRPGDGLVVVVADG